jgi:mannan endo-1,4-beta-mannosidase
LLLAVINANDTTRRIAYVLVWRNANHKNDRPYLYYALYDSSQGTKILCEFLDHEFILFEDDLPELYLR